MKRHGQLFSAFLSALLVSATMLSVPSIGAESISAYKTYVALGDSIASGFSLNGDIAKDYCTVDDNYYCAPSAAYPMVLAEKIQTDTVYDLGTMGYWAENCAKTIFDPTYEAPIVSELEASFSETYGWERKTPEETNYHFLYLSALKKADLITVEFGGNDILFGLMEKYLRPMAKDAEGNVKNALVAAALSLIQDGFLIDGFRIGDNSLSKMRKAIETYLPQMNLWNIAELLKFLTDGSFQVALVECANNAIASYGNIVDMIKYGKEITKEEYDRFVTAYAEADRKAANASDTPKVKGAMSEREILTNGRATVTDRGDGTYFMEPINPYADIVLLGLYNPYSDGEMLSPTDYNELSYFLGRMVQLAAEYFIGPTAMYWTPTEEKADEYRNQAYGFSSRFHRAFAEVENDSLYKKNAKYTWTDWQNNRNNWLESMKDKLKTVLNDMPYAILYMSLGLPLTSVLQYYNDGLNALAQDQGVPFAGVLDMKSARTLDIHPSVEGHRFIAERIYEALGKPEVQMKLMMTRASRPVSDSMKAKGAMTHRGPDEAETHEEEETESEIGENESPEEESETADNPVGKAILFGGLALFGTLLLCGILLFINFHTPKKKKKDAA